MGKKYFEKEIWTSREDKKIYGRAYIPEGDGPFPLIIYLHELLHTHRTGEDYADYFASNGIAVYLFDFCGGSLDSRSDGEMTEMSIMTEACDVEAVYSEAVKWDFVDPDKIILLGSSQGGYAAAIAATRNPEHYAGLIIMYPPLLIKDEVHELFRSKEKVPKTYEVRGWYTAGSAYALDIWDYDIYEEMKKYKKPVLLFHGDRDTTVDVSWSKKAETAFPDAKLFVMEGGGHIFHGEIRRKSIELMMDYIKKVLS
ncbi:MAG: alpha/beta hydrolase family protein [Anaerovoracaceae bacterium]